MSRDRAPIGFALGEKMKLLLLLLLLLVARITSDWRRRRIKAFHRCRAIG